MWLMKLVGRLALGWFAWLFLFRPLLFLVQAGLAELLAWQPRLVPGGRMSTPDFLTMVGVQVVSWTLLAAGFTHAFTYARKHSLFWHLLLKEGK